MGTLGRQAAIERPRVSPRRSSVSEAPSSLRFFCHREHAGPGRRDIEQAEPFDAYARSQSEDARRKAAKLGALGSPIRAPKARPM